MNKFTFLPFFLIFLFFVSCADKNITEPSNNEKVPKITSLSPGSGYPGTTVSINGENFSASQGSSLIELNSVPININEIISWSDSQIKFIINASATVGTYKISVTVNDKKSNTADFTVLQKSASAPVVNSLSKTRVTVGETIKINGKNFGATQNSSWVEFNGIKSNSYPLWQDDMIVAIVPDGADSGHVYVWVNNEPSNGLPVGIQKKFKLLSMVSISGGTFQMGNSQSEDIDNKPAHTVTITRSFDICISEITQREWMIVMDGSNPSQMTDTGEYKPVQQVTFKRAIEFCNRLSDMEKIERAYVVNGEVITWIAGSKGYRLPTEAEWEYACRASNSNAFTSAEILELAWNADNAGGKIHDVMQKKPNAWGIFDMLGNVAEWCWDEYSEDYYSKSPSTDPAGPSTEFHDRITRGGSFVNGKEKCNSEIRNSFPGLNDNYSYDLGFRVVRNK